MYWLKKLRIQDIEFVGFDEDEIEEAKEIVDYLMHDDSYLRMYGKEKDNGQNA